MFPEYDFHGYPVAGFNAGDDVLDPDRFPSLDGYDTILYQGPKIRISLPISITGSTSLTFKKKMI